jgi:hypothetical protein
VNHYAALRALLVQHADQLAKQIDCIHQQDTELLNQAVCW